MFYSATTNTFYDEDFKDSYLAAGTWPNDAQEVSQEIFEEFANGENDQGKVRVAVDGLPAWGDPKPISESEKAASERRWRDRELTRTDKYLLSDYPISESDLALVITYRSELRDYPKRAGFPYISRPAKPAL